MRKIVNISKEDVFDKKWSILGLGVLVGLIGFYVISLFNSMDFSQLEDYINSLPEAMWALLGGELDITNPYSLTNSYFYSFMWLYCGIFIVYLAIQILNFFISRRHQNTKKEKMMTKFQAKGRRISDGKLELQPLC